MPHRILGNYLYAVLASGSVALSFLASVSDSATRPVKGVVYAVGEVPVDSLSPTAMSWLGFLGAVAVVAGKTWSDIRARNRDADIADAREWGKQLGEAQSKIEVLTSRLDSSKVRLTDLEQANESKLADLKARNLELEARNKAQAADMAVMQDRIAQLVASQNSVITAVNKQHVRVKDAVTRVAELEHAVGSSSDLNLSPPADDGTNIDMPNLK